MTNNKVPYLCGGVLFFLFAQAKPSGGTARDHAAGVKDSHKAPAVMADLVYAVTAASDVYKRQRLRELQELRHLRTHPNIVSALTLEA